LQQYKCATYTTAFKIITLFSVEADNHKLFGTFNVFRKSGYGFSSTDIRNVMRKLVDYTGTYSIM